MMGLDFFFSESTTLDPIEPGGFWTLIWKLTLGTHMYRVRTLLYLLYLALSVKAKISALSYI